MLRSSNCNNRPLATLDERVSVTRSGSTLIVRLLPDTDEKKKPIVLTDLVVYDVGSLCSLKLLKSFDDPICKYALTNTRLAGNDKIPVMAANK